METKTIQEIAEVVKTLNLTFDGSLNSETLEHAISLLSPYVKWFLIRGVIEDVIFGVALVGVVFLIGRTTQQLVEKCSG